MQILDPSLIVNLVIISVTVVQKFKITLACNTCLILIDKSKTQRDSLSNKHEH